MSTADSPITQPWVCYIHTAVPHSSYALSLGLHCVFWFPAAKNKFPLPVGWYPPCH